MNYNLNLNEQWFTAVKLGKKIIEARVKTSNSKFQYSELIPGDITIFTNRTTNKKISVDVVAVRHYSDTQTMLESEGLKNVLPGYKDIQSGIVLYNSFTEYKENIPKYGIYAIEVKCRAGL